MQYSSQNERVRARNAPETHERGSDKAHMGGTGQVSVYRKRECAGQGKVGTGRQQVEKATSWESEWGIRR